MPISNEEKNERRRAKRAAYKAKKTAKVENRKPTKSQARKTKRKTKRTTNLKGRATRTDWNEIIYKIQKGPKSKTFKRELSSAGVAQVTRVRLLQAFDGIEAETQGATLFISRA